ncbi:MAG: hypothetical protein JNK65_02285 [Deltaproteobacteria bacterium]|nr:hypothetical protein [Deltaproteobacteria bacterium]
MQSSITTQDSLLSRLSSSSLEALTPLTSFQAQIDHLVSNSVQELTRFDSFASMALGASAYRLTKASLQSLSFLRSSAWLANAITVPIALGAEVTVFEGTQHLFNHLRHSQESLSFAQRWQNGYVNFGSLKLFNFLGHSQNIVIQQILSACGMVAGNHLAYQMGISSSPQGSLAEQLLSAGILNLQMSAGMGLALRLMPHLISNFSPLVLENHELDRSYERYVLRPAYAIEGAPVSSPKPIFSMSHAIEARGGVVLNVSRPSESSGNRSFKSQRNVLLSLSDECIRPLLDAAQYEAFSDYLRVELLASPDNFHLLSRVADQVAFLREACTRFTQEEPYYRVLREGLELVHLYHMRMRHRSAESPEALRDYQDFQEVVRYYLAHRKNHTEETYQQSLEKSVQHWLRDQYEESSIENEWVQQQSQYWMCIVEFVSRHLVNRAADLSQFRLRTIQDFPLAKDYFDRSREAWMSAEDLFYFYPKAALGQRLRVCLVGFGKEWQMLERYVEQGVDLVIVDPSEQVERSFYEQANLIEDYEKYYGAHIQFISTGIIEAGRREIGSFDVIEYHNVPEMMEEDSHAISKLLKPGGVFIQHHPYEIDRNHLQTQGKVREVYRAENIRGILETFSQRMAYPVGNYLWVGEKAQGTGSSDLRRIRELDQRLKQSVRQLESAQTLDEFEAARIPISEFENLWRDQLFQVAQATQTQVRPIQEGWEWRIPFDYRTRKGTPEYEMAHFVTAIYEGVLNHLHPFMRLENGHYVIEVPTLARLEAILNSKGEHPIRFFPVHAENTRDLHVRMKGLGYAPLGFSMRSLLLRDLNQRVLPWLFTFHDVYHAYTLCEISSEMRRYAVWLYQRIRGTVFERGPVGNEVLDRLSDLDLRKEERFSVEDRLVSYITYAFKNPESMTFKDFLSFRKYLESYIPFLKQMTSNSPNPAFHQRVIDQLIRIKASIDESFHQTTQAYFRETKPK